MPPYFIYNGGLGAETGSYDYFEITTPAGTAYAAANGGAAPINVPYGAFGGFTYNTLQFVEGAIDLTALIGGSGTFLNAVRFLNLYF